MSYAFQRFEKDTMARVLMRDASVSLKKSLMIAQQLRGMMSDKALALLDRVIATEQPIKFTKFTNGAGHRSGNGPGKYPIKAASAMKELVKSCVANAENKGLGTPLRIVHVTAQQASLPLHSGSRRSRSMKRTHLEIVMVETDESKKAPKKSLEQKAKENTAKPAASTQKVDQPPAEEKKPAPKSEQKAEPAKKEAPKADSKQEKAPVKAAAKESVKSEAKPAPKDKNKESGKDGN